VRTEIEQVLDFQTAWTSKNTPAMVERGVLIRDDIPNWMRSRTAEMFGNLPEHFQDLWSEGRDGTGLKSQIPWVRTFSRGRSPSATEGWYLVYLFEASGSRVYLSINQGTTRWHKGEFRPRPVSELAARATWARDVLRSEIEANDNLTPDMDLSGSTQLGRAYQAGNVFSIQYLKDALPTEEVLAADFDLMLSLLVTLYEDEENTLLIPGDPAPELIDARALADAAAGKRRTRGRNRLTSAERKAIEERAVDVTTEHLLRLGYTVKDVGLTHSFDLDARLGASRLFVEVKGTVSAGEEVVLTRNEVTLHQKDPTSSMLAIVSRIVLDRTGMVPTASGGLLRTIHPWMLLDADLTTLSYTYQVPPSNSVVNDFE
jgi:hypothetical protein